MNKKSDFSSSQEFLMDSSVEIVSILKIIAHINRFKILVLLLKGPLSFQSLLEEMDLKKSALANHLSELKKIKLVNKIQHGTYQITPLGENYIKLIENTYKENKELEKQYLESKKHQHLSKTFLERK